VTIHDYLTQLESMNASTLNILLLGTALIVNEVASKMDLGRSNLSAAVKRDS